MKQRSWQGAYPDVYIYIYTNSRYDSPIQKQFMHVYAVWTSTIDRCVSMGIDILQPGLIAGKDAKMNHGFVFLYVYIYMYIIVAVFRKYGIHDLI